MKCETDLPFVLPFLFSSSRLWAYEKATRKTVIMSLLSYLIVNTFHLVTTLGIFKRYFRWEGLRRTYYEKKDLENKAHGKQIKVRFIMPL